ncbi:hypothetical protein WJX84_001065 [Apatococcus fuscideae]|uniref:Hflx-type G domain-containing protein n=1 Tax=Apatococcus fuscideae TaxID=2026836 RepID=A0AAW1SY98_9CHLO
MSRGGGQYTKSGAEPDQLAERFFQEGQYPDEGLLKDQSLPDALGEIESAFTHPDSAVHRQNVDDDFGYTQREPERAYLVGVQLKGKQSRFAYSVHESLEELGRLASTAGLQVVGSTHQQLEMHNPKTYIGSGKIQELVAAVEASGAETLVLDDELTPGQLRSLDEAFQDRIRLCDRTALILDIFSQRAATREGQLQVELAQSEYQLPRLTRMWSHLERQAGGRVRGMGEKQIEVDKRLLRSRIAALRRSIEDVKSHRRQYRKRRSQVPVPVVALVGYTNAGKSTLLNQLTDAGVLCEDQLFATLDPTTRRITLPSGMQVLLTDTVGFIQKLPTQLVAAFRATLEEISDAALLLHVVDVSHLGAAAQAETVKSVLDDLEVGNVPQLVVWNKVDAVAQPDVVQAVAQERENTACVSAQTGQGMQDLLEAIEARLRDLLVPVDVLVPWTNGSLSGEIHKVGVVDSEEFLDEGMQMSARVPMSLASRLQPMAVSPK